jgi:hypothetical protein
MRRPRHPDGVAPEPQGGERRLAEQRNHCPRDTSSVGAAGTFDDHAADGDDDRRKDHPTRWTLSIEQRPDQPDDDRHTGDGNRNRRRLRMSDSADQRH